MINLTSADLDLLMIPFFIVIMMVVAQFLVGYFFSDLD